MQMEQTDHQTHTLVALVRVLLVRWWLILSRDPVSILEMWFGGWAALWGGLLFGAWESFASPAWVLIRATHISENIFGVWLVVWGILQAIEVPSRRGRMLVSFVLMVTWALIAIALMWVNPATTGSGIYPVFTAAQVYIFLRLASRPQKDVQ